MPIVQAAIVRAVSLPGDSPGIFTAAPVVSASAQFAYARSGCRSIQRFYETPADPAGEWAELRSMQPKQNVSIYHNPARRKVAEGS